MTRPLDEDFNDLPRFVPGHGRADLDMLYALAGKLRVDALHVEQEAKKRLPENLWPFINSPSHQALSMVWHYLKTRPDDLKTRPDEN